MTAGRERRNFLEKVFSSPSPGPSPSTSKTFILIESQGGRPGRTTGRNPEKQPGRGPDRQPEPPCLHAAAVHCHTAALRQKVARAGLSFLQRKGCHSCPDFCHSCPRSGWQPDRRQDGQEFRHPSSALRVHSRGNGQLKIPRRPAQAAEDHAPAERTADSRGRQRTGTGPAIHPSGLWLRGKQGGAGNPETGRGR